jgi:hypothetical protein
MQRHIIVQEQHVTLVTSDTIGSAAVAHPVQRRINAGQEAAARGSIDEAVEGNTGGRAARLRERPLGAK